MIVSAFCELGQVEPIMPSARVASELDLEPLLELFRVASAGPVIKPVKSAQRVWRDLLRHDGVTVFVSAVDGRILAACTLLTAPSLLQGGRGNAFIENVVTHPDFKGDGHTRAVVRAAVAKAWRIGCHHVLLQSSEGDVRLSRFYERCGFRAGSGKTYVARRRPSGRMLRLEYFRG